MCTEKLGGNCFYLYISETHNLYKFFKAIEWLCKLLKTNFVPLMFLHWQAKSISTMYRCADRWTLLRRGLSAGQSLQKLGFYPWRSVEFSNLVLIAKPWIHSSNIYHTTYHLICVFFSGYFISDKVYRNCSGYTFYDRAFVARRSWCGGFDVQRSLLSLAN